ncbi:MAG: hypothetical protein K6G22_06110 [Lachnospiraceae bacterium]|nr:hypothetical protein [Lachnospiraceae bacterium]
MELTVYRQAIKERPDGTIVYKGEDALPFVNDKAMIVCDGLGGAAAIRHQNIDPGLFDREKITELLFGDLINGGFDPSFDRYVKDSFLELYAVKDCYTDNVNNIKKSGYFASRLVSAILLAETVYSPREGFTDKWIKALSEKTRVDRKKSLETAGKIYAGSLREKLIHIANKVNLTYESAYSGLALLGTTLCMTLFSETDDSVRAVYLTAGDSRPYLWNETEGLCQLIPDEEGPDGGMTNYIRANEDTDFSINVSYFEFKKPCILFNASDGCFDSAAFLSPMAFEKLLLDTFISSDFTDSAGDKLTEFFKEYGRHDDSSTIAMKMFGYEDFTEVKKSAQIRLKELDDKYLSKCEGLLLNDYHAELLTEQIKDVEMEKDDPTVTEEEKILKLKADLQQALFENYEHDHSKYMDESEETE